MYCSAIMFKEPFNNVELQRSLFNIYKCYTATFKMVQLHVKTSY